MGAAKTNQKESPVLTSKAALVTGSTSGIGLAIAEALAANGCHVILNGLGDKNVIEQTRSQMEEKHGVSVLYHGADLSKSNEIEDMMDFAETHFGGIDVLVNNAGIQHVALTEDFPVEKWNAIIAINMNSNFHTTRLALPSMKRKNWGRIINVASAHGLVGSAQKSAYVTAKHGVVGFTKVTGLETAQTGITVNAICPGWVRTELVEKQIAARSAAEGISIDDAAKSLLIEKQPSLQFVTPTALADTALFLCSESADQITGTTISMDGGWTAQ